MDTVDFEGWSATLERAPGDKQVGASPTGPLTPQRTVGAAGVATAVLGLVRLLAGLFWHR